MNKVATISLSAIGLSALFAVAFIGFAKVNGAPLHTLPVIGSLFPEEAGEHGTDEHGTAPETAHGETSPAGDPHGTPESGHGTEAPHGAQPAHGDEHAADPAAGHGETVAAAGHGGHEAPPKPDVGVRNVQAGVFGMLDGDALYGQDELRTLADSLRAKNRTADQRLADLDRREELLQDRLTALEERRRTLEDFAKQLESREREVAAREAEAGRDDTVAEGGGLRALPAGELASFFAEGETEVLVQRLAGFTAADTAEILARLTPARAKELLDALPSARWRECAEAYALAVQKAAQPPPPAPQQ